MDGGISSSSRAEKGEPSADPVERARAICLRLLTGTPRTRKQLADALSKKGIPEDAAQEVLSRFEEVGLINDSAFADAWVESRHHGRGLARRALAQELRTKGVDSTLIEAAVSQLDSEQEERPRVSWWSASCVPPAASTGTSGCADWRGCSPGRAIPRAWLCEWCGRRSRRRARRRSSLRGRGFEVGWGPRGSRLRATETPRRPHLRARHPG
ncbi:hypothetical protein B1R27_37960 [Streptomyces sp. GKU 895]|nr:hypothetical protein B1R27_37960 [Streptomyces sp. GKU 895]